MSKTYVTVADTAKYIRKALKAAHPGVKFSVRSSSYAGGASVRVSFTRSSAADPTASQVQETTQHYVGASFDGMTDMKSHHSTLVALEPGALPVEVSWGADYVFVDCDLTPEFKAECEAAVLALADRCQTGRTVDGRAETSGDVWRRSPGSFAWARIPGARHDDCSLYEAVLRYAGSVQA